MNRQETMAKNHYGPNVTKARYSGNQWVWIIKRTCTNGHEMRLVAGPTKVFGRERGPSLPPGATLCSCGARVSF